MQESGTRPDAGEMTDADREIAQLTRLAELRREGVLTDDEFESKKREIIGSGRRGRRKRTPWSRRRKIVSAGLVAAVVLGGGGTATALKIQNDQEEQEAAEAARERAAERAEAEAEAREEARRKARAEAEAQRAEDQIEVSMRRLIVQDLRKSVTEDFEGRVTDGLLAGPILETSCNPVGGGIADLNVQTGKFECLVATEDLGDGRLRGYPVDATVNYTKGSYTWGLAP